tara:strand:+ start:1056 stop:1505 length:450 start_codon:yes stop_codon:yes gene_type:complete
MRTTLFFLLLFSISFSQNQINKSEVVGKWEVEVKVKKLLKEEIKNLDMFEKIAVELASGYAEDIFDSANIYVIFRKNNTALLTVDFLEYEEKEEIQWSIVDNEILIDDSLNKKINIGSENNKWILENGIIFFKDKNQGLNKNIFLRKVL